MPYPKWFLHAPASAFQPHLNWKTSYTVLSPPSPQGTGQLSARAERRGEGWWAAPSLLPPAKGSSLGLVPCVTLAELRVYQSDGL